MNVEQVAKRLNFEYCKTTYYYDDRNTNTKDTDNECKKDTTVTSQSSSNENARGVKRKLDFEYELSRSSNLRLNVRRERDTSLQSEQFSPISRSYYVQSVGGQRTTLSNSSRDKVRKNLFGTRTGSEPTLKKRKLNSSLGRSNTLNSSLNKGKFSLHKNFPGVLKGPSSRGQLLLNLAVTKYNTTKENSNTNIESPVFKSHTSQPNDKEHKMENKNEGSVKGIITVEADPRSHESVRLNIVDITKNDVVRQDCNLKSSLQGSNSDLIKQTPMIHGKKDEEHLKRKNSTPKRRSRASFKVFTDNARNSDMKANSVEMSPVFADISNRCTTKSPKLVFKDIFQKLELIKEQKYKATPHLTMGLENTTSNKVKTRSAKEPVKWIRKDVFSKSIQDKRSYENNNNSFGTEHLHRFLNDCMNNTTKDCCYSSSISQVKSNQVSKTLELTPLKDKPTLLSNQSPVFTSIKRKNLSAENDTSTPIFKNALNPQKNIEKKNLKTEQQKWNEFLNNQKTPDMKIKSFYIVDETPSTTSKDCQVEKVFTPDSLKEAPTATPLKEIHENRSEMETFDSDKKRRSKHLTDGLANRMNVLKNRQLSSVRIWQYESSKRKTCGTKSNIGGVFLVSKMWKERSLYLVQCSTMSEKTEYEENKEIILILSQEQVIPKLASGSVIEIYPPWNILYLDKLNVTVMVSIRKLQIVKKDTTTKENCTKERDTESMKLCKCEGGNCECSKNNKMNIMWHVLSLNDVNKYSNAVFAISDENIHNTRGTVRELLSRRVLLPNKYLKLHLKIQHVCRCSVDETNYLCIAASDKHAEYCRVLMKDDGGQDLSNVMNDKHVAIEGLTLLNNRIIERSNCTCCEKEWKIWTFLFNNEYGNLNAINEEIQ